MNKPKVFADLHNADTQGRVRLNCIGTIEDLARQQIVLRDGVCLTLYSEELGVEGVVEYSTDEHLWVAVIDWRAIKDLGRQSSDPNAKRHSDEHVTEEEAADLTNDHQYLEALNTTLQQ